MIFSTITQDMLELSTNEHDLPTQFSSNIEIKFVQDTENFSGYIPTVYASVFDSQFIQCGEVLNKGGSIPINSGVFKLPSNILDKDGYLAIGITLTKDDENVALGPIIYKIKANVGGLSPLPEDDDEWQQVVTSYVNSLYNQDYKPLYDQALQDINEAVETANTASLNATNALNTANETSELINQKVNDGSFIPSFTVGETETGEAGTAAEVEITGTKKEPVLNFTIPKGIDGSGQTTIKKDSNVLTEVDLVTERISNPTSPVKVQLQDEDGNIFYVETSAENVYVKGADGSEITLNNLHGIIGQLINAVGLFSVNPVQMLSDLNNYIPSITTESEE